MTTKCIVAGCQNHKDEGRFVGDALRLAVKLKISPIQIIDEPICAAYWTDVMCCNQSHGDDPYAATRRAIVRAAAEIGERMK